MNRLPEGVDTIEEITFIDVVQTLGATTIQEVISHAHDVWDQDSNDGVTFSSDKDTVTLSIFRDRGVNFMYGGLGPYVLSLERAQQLLGGELPQ